MKPLFNKRQAKKIVREYETDLSMTIAKLAKRYHCTITPIRRALFLFKCKIRPTCMRKQFPNKLFKFRCGHSGILPPNRGLSNKVAYWTRFAGREETSYWICYICKVKDSKTRAKGKGPQGLLGRMRYLLRGGKDYSNKRNYKPPKITAENLLASWLSQKGRCAWTQEKLDILQAQLDHCHKTGKFRGFVKSHANYAEGGLGKLSFSGRANLFAHLYPREVKKAFDLLRRANA